MPLVSYIFGCNSSNEAHFSFDLWLGDLIADSDLPACEFSSNGVTSATLVESSSTVGLLREEFLRTDATGLVLEVWMIPKSENDMGLTKPIVTIGGRHEKTEGCQGSELFLGQRGNLLEIGYSDNDTAQTCRVLIVEQQPMVPNELLQVMIVIDQGETNVYFNGVPVISRLRNEFQPNLAKWDPNLTLQLFSNHIEPSHFTGSLHQVFIYNQAIDKDQVTFIYERGLERFNHQRNDRKPLQLVANTEPSNVVQGQASSFSVGGYNASTNDWQVMVEITSLPQFGLLLGDDGPVNAPGYRIPLTGNAIRTSLFYRAWSEGYFNVPSFSYSGQDLEKPGEFFSYRLIALDSRDEETILGWSEPVQQDLDVIHVNHPPLLLAPMNVFVAPVIDSSGATARPVASVEGLELQDPDLNMDRVRVDIWAENGTLTIQKEFLRLADFESCSTRSSAWQCHGTGLANRNMTFLAEPDDASKIFSSLQYNAFFWDQEDVIVVRVYDGSGGPCLKEEEHRVRFSTNDNFFDDNARIFNTIHDECFEIVASIHIPAVTRQEEAGQGPAKEFFQDLFETDSFDIADIVFWGVIGTLALACCISIQTCIKCFGRRGRKVYPDGIDYGVNGIDNV